MELDNLSSGEKVNPRRCFIYFFGFGEVEKEVVNILTSRLKVQGGVVAHVISDSSSLLVLGFWDRGSGTGLVN